MCLNINAVIIYIYIYSKNGIYETAILIERGKKIYGAVELMPE